MPSGTVRHRECYERSAIASRQADNAAGRYSLLGLSEDILDVIALAERGGIGPVGPEFQRLYWDGVLWTQEKPSVESAKPSET